MIIVIPSTGRPDPENQTTANQLIRDGVTNKFNCIMIVKPTDRRAYARNYEAHFTLLSAGSSDFRNFIMYFVFLRDNRLILLDDDLHFYHDDADGDALQLVQEMQNAVEDYAAVGIGENKPFAERENATIHHALAFDRTIFWTEKIDFTSDLHGVLSLVELGYPNYRLGHWWYKHEHTRAILKSKKIADLRSLHPRTVNDKGQIFWETALGLKMKKR